MILKKISINKIFISVISIILFLIPILGIFGISNLQIESNIQQNNSNNKAIPKSISGTSNDNLSKADNNYENMLSISQKFDTPGFDLSGADSYFNENKVVSTTNDKSGTLFLQDFYFNNDLTKMDFVIVFNISTTLKSNNGVLAPTMEPKIIQNTVQFSSKESNNDWVYKESDKESKIYYQSDTSESNVQVGIQYSKEANYIDYSVNSKLSTHWAASPNTNYAADSTVTTKLNSISILIDWDEQYVKNNMKANLKNVNVDYESSTSASIFNKGNLEGLKTIADAQIDQYVPINLFRSLNGNYMFRQETENKLDISFSFNDPITHKPIDENSWKISLKFKFTISTALQHESFFNRIFLEVGDKVSSSGIGMDKGDIIVDNVGEGKDSQYNNGVITVNASLSFSFYEYKKYPNGTNFDNVTIDGNSIDILDSFSNKNMYDKKEANIAIKDEDRQYKIHIIHFKDKSETIANDTDIDYNLTVNVRTVLSNVNISKMNWSPDSDEAKNLTDKTIKDEKGNDIENPNYDKEVNINSGLKNQLVWVNRKVQNGNFALDPVNENGVIIGSDLETDYELGFLAEANVSTAAGTWTTWESDAAINEAERHWSSNNLSYDDLTTDHPPVKLLKESTNTQSTTGVYCVTYNEYENFGQKIFVVSGNNNFKDKFTDFIDDKYAQNFWVTSHGYHLKKYMQEYRGIVLNTDDDFNKLSYEQILSYWNDYVYKIKAFAFNSTNLKAKYDLSKISLSDIKINVANSGVDDVKANIEKSINTDFEKYNNSSIENTIPINTVDYDIYYYDSKNQSRLLNDDLISKLITGNTILYNVYLKATIISNTTQGKSADFKLTNTLNNIDENNYLRLGSVMLNNLDYNFDNTEIETWVDIIKDKYIEKWIKSRIDKALAEQKFNFKSLNYDKVNDENNDYDIYINYGLSVQINLADSDDSVLDAYLLKFMEKDIRQFNVTIIANEQQGRAKGMRTYSITNDENSPSAPQEGPDGESGGITDPGNKDINLSDITIDDLIYDFSSLDIEDFIRIYINEYVERILKSNNLNLTKDVHYEIVIPDFDPNSSIDLHNPNQVKYIDNFLNFDTSSPNEVKNFGIRIKAIQPNNSPIKIEGYFDIKMSNSLTAPKPPDPPEIPQAEKEHKKVNLIFIVVGTILGLSIIGLITFLLVKRYRKPKLY